MFKKIGPGVLIAAAFIGPGTIATCTLAGVHFGYALLWAMLLSVIMTIVFQEMAARIGLITKKGLASNFRDQIKRPWVRGIMVSIILAAIVVGNAAYEAGNIGGAILGIEAMLGEGPSSWHAWLIGGIAFFLLYQGSYKTLEKLFISLVLVMSISFVVTAIITGPAILDILEGMFVPTIPENGLLTIVALIGTTVVPYNLFLHASLVSEKWNSDKDLGAVRLDTIISIVLGGTISIAIIITANAIQQQEVLNGLDLAKGLEPLYGNAAKYIMGIGLFAAGITSAITAPLAAAYVAASCFDWEGGLRSFKFRMVWGGILLIGVLSQSFDFRPIEIIKFAQIANGLLLPIICIFLLWVVNKSSLMGKYKNSRWHNLLGIILLLLIVVLGLKSIGSVIGII